MDCSMPGFPVHHQLPEIAQTHVHHVRDVIQPSRPLSSPSPPAFNLSQHQGLSQWVSSSNQVAKVLEFQCASFSLKNISFFLCLCLCLPLSFLLSLSLSFFYTILFHHWLTNKSQLPNQNYFYCFVWMIALAKVIEKPSWNLNHCLKGSLHCGILCLHQTLRNPQLSGL